MQEPGIEPGAQRWQRWILPLNHSCFKLLKQLRHESDLLNFLSL